MARTQVTSGRRPAPAGSFSQAGDKSHVLLFVLLVLFLAISGLPSRLYGAYQREWVFSSLTLTMIFAVYALAALLVVGRLSDSIGRKPGSARRRRKASRAGRMPVPRGASRVEAAACMVP
jgi:MFS family permease